jgi:hypothetical protein
MTNQTNYLKVPFILLGVLVLSSGLSCAVAPETNNGPPVTAPVTVDTASVAIKDAYTSYERRDYAGAASGFGSVLSSGKAAAEDQVLANLGMALIHLSTDSEWRDLAQAGAALQAAEGIESTSSSVESGMLMNALSSLIGVETNISELNSKASNSSAEITRLKSDLAAAKTEQDALNEALEKLKAITIGN